MRRMFATPRRCILALTAAVLSATANPVQLSGIYPHLAFFNDEGECGTGAVVPWADRLWVVTYAPHMPQGSSDKLYEITPDLRLLIRPESIGGTSFAAINSPRSPGRVVLMETEIRRQTRSGRWVGTTAR